MDVQNQGAWPSGKRAKFSHGPCDNRDAEFNFDPQIIAVAEEMLLHRLDGNDLRKWPFSASRTSASQVPEKP